MRAKPPETNSICICLFISSRIRGCQCQSAFKQECFWYKYLKGKVNFEICDLFALGLDMIRAVSIVYVDFLKNNDWYASNLIHVFVLFTLILVGSGTTKFWYCSKGEHIRVSHFLVLQYKNVEQSTYYIWHVNLKLSESGMERKTQLGAIDGLDTLTTDDVDGDSSHLFFILLL